MTPDPAKIVEQALLDAVRHGQSGDADKIVEYLKSHPEAVEDLIREHSGEAGDQAHAR